MVSEPAGLVRTVCYLLPILLAAVTFSFALLNAWGILTWNPWLGHLPGLGSVFVSHILGWGNLLLAACGPAYAAQQLAGSTRRRVVTGILAAMGGMITYVVWAVALLAIIGRG